VQSAVDKIPWKLLLSRKEVWAIILSHFCHNWGVFILLTWMPTYYSVRPGPPACSHPSDLIPFKADGLLLYELGNISSAAWPTCGCCH
jgi:hypothetical protein